MKTTLLPCVEIEPEAGPATHSVLCLHGLGADGNDLAPLAQELGLSARVRWILPHAPSIPVTLNGGLRMPAWYDIRELSMDRRDHDEAGIAKTTAQVRALIEREASRGVPASRLVLMGFSQGGAMALHIGLRHPERLAGIVGLSTYLLFDSLLDTERSAANAATPIFMGHGSHDPMVPFEAGRKTMERLRGLGHPVTWKSYPIQHAISGPELEDLAAWFAGRLRAD